VIKVYFIKRLCRRANRLSLATSFAFVLIGCAARQSQISVENSVSVEIRIAPAPDELPFNPRGERLLAARRQLSLLLGHGLEFDIDAALAAEWKSDFEHQLIESIEGLLRLLTELRERDAGEFSRTVQVLARVECRYSVLVEDAKATFTRDTLLIEQPAHPQRLIDYGEVLNAFHERDVNQAEARFVAMQPEGVAPSDLEAYFRWISSDGFGYRWDKRHPAARARNETEKIANDRRGDVISSIVRLYPKTEVKGIALSTEVREWLIGQLSWLSQLYRVSEQDLPPLGSNTPMRRGERALCGWLERELPRGNPKERLKALDSIFPADGPLVCPNIDRFAFGLREADAWLKAGKPAERDEGGEQKLMDGVVCPSLRDATRKPVRHSGCRSTWLRYSLNDDGLRKRLASALDTRDPELTEQLLASLEYDSKANVVYLVHLLNPHKPAFKAALTALADVWGSNLPKGSMDLLADIWRTEPQLRGDVLYVFARTQGNSFWGKFAAEFGPIGETDLARLLDQGELAFVHLLDLWPAIDRGVSRVQPIVNHLAVLLPDASQPSAGPALRVLAGVVQRLCGGRSRAELASLHAALAARAADRASERTALAVLLRDTAATGCAERKKENSTDEP